jgi:hypothetical protein
MNSFPKARRTIKLWQLLLAIALVGVVLGLLPSQRVAVAIFLFIEASLLIALFVFLVLYIAKRFRNK